MTTATKWWHRKDDQLVCTLCPRECALHEGQRGFCFVRQNIQDEMVLTTYGRSSGFCIDPIEKKPLNHFLPGTPILSFGTAGCNLGCKFCQNWSISKAKEFDDQTDFASPEAIAQAALRHGCRSVAFTYNDPVIWAEYAIETAKACHDVGLKTVAVTAGYISAEARGDFYSVMDAANVDLKGFTPEFYKFVTLSKLDPVLETLRWLKHESDVWFEITNLMIPGENDSADETARMCDWIVENLGPDVPVHFTAFHPDFRMQDIPRTPAATLNRARKQALAAGIQFAYVGNVHELAGQSTYCPRCQTLLIERDWYVLGQYDLAGNACGKCGEAIPGVFEDRPGTWGARRQPIRISEPMPVQLSFERPVASSASHSSPSSTPGQNPEMAKSPLGWLASVFTASTAEPVRASGTPAPPAPENVPTVRPRKVQTVVESKVVTGTRIDFAEAESVLIAAHARAAAVAVLDGLPLPELTGPLGATPAYGMFVSFKQGEKLRGCKGQFGELVPLGTMLNLVVQDSATNDPRFPPVRPDELSRLSLEVSLMYGPRKVQLQGEARATEVEVGRHGLVISHARGRGLLLPQVATERGWDARTFLQAVCRKANLPTDAWTTADTQLMTFEARLFHSAAVATGPTIRPAFRAGQFYPAKLAEMQAKIAEFLGTETADARQYPAVMLPHAGWTYCGEVMGKTLARVQVPRLVIVVGPKHTAHGPPWSVSDADLWEIPGHQIPVATELRSRLIELVPSLACEAAAHAQEHAVEVILPFLHARNPNVQVLPIELGPMSYSQTEQFAQGIAILCRECRDPILLVISSDMNHFAAESENRRLDFLAIDAMRTGNAGNLFDTVQQNRISMCGVMPAVTILRSLEFLGRQPQPELVHYDNSSTASGQFDRVVGYAGMVIP